jgi:O-methyltransferase/aklanonic acid methyltransferase
MPEPIVASKQTLEALFDGAAATYDRAGPSLFAAWGARLVELMALKPGDHLLDVATGRGAVLLPAAHQVGPTGRAVGIDLSLAMIEEAAASSAALGLRQVTAYKMDAERLDFADASFDAVACAFGLFMFPAQEVALREMTRVCRAGSVAGFAMFGRTPPPFDPAWSIFGQQAQAYGVSMRLPQRVALTRDELAGLIERAGLGRVEIISETTEAIYPTEDDWWAFQLTLGTRATILAMDEPTRARFKADYLAKLRPLFQTDGLHLPANVLYAIART